MRFLVHLQSLLSRSVAVGVVASISMLVAAPSAHAAGTAAGTNISNTASASYTDPNGKAVTLTSNTVQITVDEILNVKVAAAAPAAAPAPAAASVDIEPIMDKLADDHGGDLNWRTSIVDLMKLLDIDSSLEHRKQLAEELKYDGDMDDSASMNIWLHKHVMTELAANGGKVPADLTA